MNVREIINKVIAEKYLNNAPTLKALLETNEKAKTEYIEIIKNARYDATEV